MSLYAKLSLQSPGAPIWQSKLFFVIFSIIFSQTSLSRRCNIGLIPALVMSIKKSLYPCMRNWFILFLIGTEIMIFESNYYIIKCMIFLLLKLWGSNQVGPLRLYLLAHKMLLRLPQYNVFCLGYHVPVLLAVPVPSSHSLFLLL